MKRDRLKITGIIVICMFLSCLVFTGCGSIMRNVMGMMDSAKGAFGDNMHYEDKMLGYSMEIPYEWEIAEPSYFDEGGIAWFDPNPEVYGRDDMQMSVLYLPNGSYTENIENLEDFMAYNIIPDNDNFTLQIVDRGVATKQIGEVYAVTYRMVYKAGGWTEFKMYMVPSENGLYVLHYSSGSSVDARFIKEAENAVDTFSISTGKMTPNDYKMAAQPYQNDVLGFRIEYIANWNINEVEENEKGGTVELFPAVSQNADEKLTIIYTTEYGLSGARDAYEAAMKETGAKVKNENYVNAPNMELAYGSLFMTKGSDGKTITTQLYIIPDEGNACYFAYYSWSDETYEKFVEECEINLRGFEIIGSSLEGYVSTGKDSVISYGLDCDYTLLVEEKISPEKFVETYGKASEIKKSKIDDISVTSYVYDTFTIDFINRKGTLEATGLLNTSPESPIGISGSQTGSNLDDADNALRANGYKAKQDLSTDTEKYYSGKSLDGNTCLVVLYMKNNIVSKTQGWYGAPADAIIKQAAQ